MKKKIKKLSLGFIPDVIKDDHFILGGDVSLDRYIIQLDGQWTPYLPVVEDQIKNFDTDNCVGFGTLHALQTLMKKKFGIEENYSDRFLGIEAGTVPPGNSPHTVAQALRHSGCIPEPMLPFSDDLQDVNEYYSFKGTDKVTCEKEGQRWLQAFSVGHEWVLQGGEKPDDIKSKLMYALKLSPLGTAVYAWAQDSDGLYISIGAPCHWVCLFGYVEGKYWLVFDSYANEVKKLAWDFNFGQTKRFSIDRIVPRQSWWQRFWAWLGI